MASGLEGIAGPAEQVQAATTKKKGRADGVPYLPPGATETVTGITEGTPPGVVESSMGAKTTSGNPTPLAPVGGIQGEIDKILQPYLQEVGSLGPEYSKEMDFLKPYMAGTATSDSTLTNEANAAVGGGVQAPNPNALPGESDLSNAQNALTATMEGQTPGFGALNQANKQFEGTVPYSSLIQTALTAGKNELQGYSTVPNFTNVNTSQWPAALQQVWNTIQSSVGVNPNSGLANPSTVQQANQNQPAGYQPPGQGTNPNQSQNPFG